MEAFREIDHSGDVGIEASGSDIADLLANVTRGLFALQYHGRVERNVERKIHVESESTEDLVVDWLSEVIAVGGARGELYSEVSLLEASERRARGVLRGERFSEAAHEPRFDVKAVTYHGLEVRRRGGVWRVRVIFDL